MEEIIPLNHLNNYCKHFKVTMDYLLNLTDDNFYFNYRYSKEMNKKVIGKNVQIIRRKNKITQKELAEMFNTSQSTVSAYENGKTLVLTVFIYSLAVKFNLSVDKLCGRTKNKNYIYN